jgi:predicted negative regulator of RcsB-dependent stress response
MSAHLDDEEQLVAIKTWWQENGRYTLCMIALSIMVWGGWHYWQYRTVEINRAASSGYEVMLALESDKTLTSRVDEVIAAHGGTMYGMVARLKKVQQLVLVKDYEGAKALLQIVMKKADAPVFKQIARLRFARILIFQGKLDESLSILAIEDDPGLKSWIYWLEGDCYRLKGESVRAAALYRQALPLFAEHSFAYSVISMQLMTMDASLSAKRQ